MFAYFIFWVGTQSEALPPLTVWRVCARDNTEKCSLFTLILLMQDQQVFVDTDSCHYRGFYTPACGGVKHCLGETEWVTGCTHLNVSFFQVKSLFWLSFPLSGWKDITVGILRKHASSLQVEYLIYLKQKTEHLSTSASRLDHNNCILL